MVARVFCSALVAFSGWLLGCCISQGSHSDFFIILWSIVIRILKIYFMEFFFFFYIGDFERFIRLHDFTSPGNHSSLIFPDFP